MKTIEQFLEALRYTPRDWRILVTGQDVIPGALRRGNTDTKNYQCPLGAVACPNKQAVIDAKDYGELWGLSSEDTVSVINAADRMSGYDPKLRQRLLGACGLTEAVQ